MGPSAGDVVSPKVLGHFLQGSARGSLALCLGCSCSHAALQQGTGSESAGTQDGVGGGAVVQSLLRLGRLFCQCLPSDLFLLPQYPPPPKTKNKKRKQKPQPAFFSRAQLVDPDSESTVELHVSDELSFISEIFKSVAVILIRLLF